MIAIIGAGGHGLVVKDLLQSLDMPYFFVDEYKKGDFKCYPIVPIQELSSKVFQSAIIAIGNNLDRRKIAKEYPINYSSLIHTKAIISSSIRSIGEGTVIMAGSIIQTDASIGKHCIINTASVIEHETIIGDFVHIAPNATICGNVTIGTGAMIGAGAIVLPGIHIGNWSIIGAGSVVTKDVLIDQTVIGCPAKPINSHVI